MMGDEDDRRALIAQGVDDAEELVGFFGGDGRGRLIQNQHPRLGDQRLGDLGHLLQGDAEAAHLRVRIEGMPSAASCRGGAPVERRPIDDAPASQRLPAEIHVAADVEMGNEIELLMDGADAQLLGGVGIGQVTGLPSRRISPASGW